VLYLSSHVAVKPEYIYIGS